MAYQLIIEVIKQILEERGEAFREMPPSTPILETGLDSLDVATLVVRLEDRLGFDPFSNSDIKEFPQTLGGLAELYEQVGPGSRNR